MGAPPGNSNAEGHGRPPLFEETDGDYKVLSALIESYFEWIKGEFEVRERTYVKKSEDGEPELITEEYDHCIRKPEPPTVTGLALSIGFSSKDTLYRYAKKDYFSYPIKRGLSKIEQNHEFKISEGDKCTGNIFALKNMGWHDKQYIEQKNMDIPLTEDEIKEAKEKLDEDY